MDKAFKREFHDVPAVQVEQLYKLFRRRPRLELHFNTFLMIALWNDCKYWNPKLQFKIKFFAGRDSADAEFGRCKFLILSNILQGSEGTRGWYSYLRPKLWKSLLWAAVNRETERHASRCDWRCTNRTGQRQQRTGRSGTTCLGANVPLQEEKSEWQTKTVGNKSVTYLSLRTKWIRGNSYMIKTRE